MLAGNEWRYVKECLDSGWVSSAGEFVERFEEAVKDYTGASYAVACVNGSAALQVALRVAGVTTDDEVIVPSLTFIAPVNAIRLNGANPVFMDVDEYYNIDVDKTAEFLETHTILREDGCWNRQSCRKIVAILPVHVFGNAVRLEPLLELCEKFHLTLIEDAAESLGTVYTEGSLKGRHTGTIGKLGCLSFNGNKIITTGGGGMILTNNEKLAEKARYLTTQAKDDPVSYIHNEIGYNFRLTNIQAALGVAQLEQLPIIIKRKKEIYKFYNLALENIEGLSIGIAPDYAQNNHWLNILRIDNNIFKEGQKYLMQRLRENKIETRSVWALNHLQKPYRSYQNYMIDEAIKLVDKSLCMPSSANLTDENLIQIIECLESTPKKLKK